MDIRDSQSGPMPSSARRRRVKYIATLILFVALIGGWSWFWHFAAGKAEETAAGWRAREAAAGRVYECGSQTIGGYPFRYEIAMEEPRLAEPSGWGLAAPRLDIVASALDPSHAVIVAPQFEGKRTIQRHQLVYGTLGALMGREIHALTMQVLSPHEAAAAPAGGNPGRG